MVSPPVESLHESLKYHELSWSSFEHLCRRLVSKTEPQATDVRLYLSEGYKQEGIDGYAYDPADEMYVAFQCKRNKEFGADDVRNAVDKFLEGDFVAKSKKFILCVTAHVDGPYESELAKQRKRLHEKKITFITWDQRGLDRLLKNEAQLVYEFFDGCREPKWVRCFCGEDKVKELRKPASLREYPAPTAFVERHIHAEQEIKGVRSTQRPSKTLTDLLSEDSLLGPCRLFLRSEAGNGKSTEIANAAYFFAADQGVVLYPVLLTLKNYVDEHLPDWLDRRQSGWQDVPAERLLLLVDGLDEVKSDEREKFIRRLRSLLEDHPACHIVLSCRTNFSNEKLQFDDFTTYNLREFERADIDAYIKQVLRPDEVLAFDKLLDDDALLQWLKNPFSLIQFVKFFREDPATVPRTRVDLLNKVVKQRIDRDLTHHRGVNAAPTYYRLLKRIAFVMNRLGVNSLSEVEWSRVVPDSIERERCRELSLLHIVDGRVSFEHNILQEYFSALVLADQPFERATRSVSFRPTYERVKPKWFNTIGLWLEITPGTSFQSSQLLKLISEKEPQLLLTIEYQHFTDDLRFAAFQQILQQSDRVPRHRLHYDSRLTDFANIRGNSQVIAYLLKQAADSNSEISSECLFYLSKADPAKLFGYESEICELLEKELTKNNRFRQELAVEVAVDLHLASARITQLVTQGMPNLDSVRIRDDVYRYLRQTNQAEAHIDFLLEGIDVYRGYRDREPTTYSGVGWGLLDLLSHLHTATSLHRLLDYLVVHTEEIDDTKSLFRYSPLIQESFFSKLSGQLATAYNTDQNLYDKVAKLYKKLNKYSAETFAEDLSLFFDLTGTQEPIFWELLQSESLWSYFRLVGKIATTILIEECLRQYKQDALTDRQMWCVIHGLRMNKRPEMSEWLRIEAGKVNRDNFAPSVDYEVNRQQRDQYDYELLADQALFIEEVEEVFTYYRSDEVKVDALYQYRREWTELDNEVVIHFLTSFWNEKMVKRADVVKWLEGVSNWEFYVLSELLSRLQNKNYFLFPQVHLDRINQWCQDNVGRANFRESIRLNQTEAGTTQEWLEWYLSEFYRLTDVKFSKDVLLDMLGTEFYGLQWDHNEDKPTLSSKIIDQLSDRDAIAHRLIENLRLPFTTTIIRMNHFELCRRLEVKEAIPFLKDAIQSDDRYKDHERNRLLAFYKELGGQLSQLTFIFSVFESESDFSWNLLEELTELPGYKRRVSDFLLKQLGDNKLGADNFRVIRLLINAEAVEGLRLYADWVKTNREIPQTYNRLDGVKNLPAQEATEIFLDLIAFGFENTVSGDRFHDPIDLFTHELKELVITDETLFKHVQSDLTSVLASYPDHTEHFKLQRNLAQLEQEYYLQKVDYASVAEALDGLHEYDI
ncbi:NACHT domain-containing protein [uncultured Spirosoma sp.]|uniref:NACHT domain-containing protein n=1 Tax=uncultured Spirosoma sp. TaxID=278208 RepID=UPI00258F4508|nr:NACHT domain-containing protein [uncultured Spirosoma sp.]